MAKPIGSLDANERHLLSDALAWADPYWDERVGLIDWSGDIADPHQPRPQGRHLVRDSAWYALGLLMRDAAGDRERALRAIETVLSYQYNEPGRIYHGTFLRYPGEQHPPEPAVKWRDYDPNWREFIITTLQIVLHEYGDLLPRDLTTRIDAATRLAVAGALGRGLLASYTNIALMNAFMLCEAGERFGEPGWITAGEAMAREVYGLFSPHAAFAEYNSPTYYGTDLYALGLWRSYSSSGLLRKLGAEMEADLWRDIARFYHAGLCNLCGPYDRSYGMDMREYVALTGAWIRLVTGKSGAPLPSLDRPFAHSADLLFTPVVVVMGARVPAEALPHLLSFQGERFEERAITDAPRRVATAWLGNEVMLGAEESGLTYEGEGQYHPATAHWRIGADGLGWLKLCNQQVDAHAGPHRLQIRGHGELVFRVHAPGARVEDVQANLWRFPGLTVSVESNATAVRVEDEGGTLKICYGSDGTDTVCDMDFRWEVR